MSHVLAFSIKLDDQIWKRLELMAIADDVHEDLRSIFKSHIINEILDRHLPKTASDLPGLLADENTPAGRWYAEVEKYTDKENAKP